MSEVAPGVQATKAAHLQVREEVERDVARRRERVQESTKRRAEAKIEREELKGILAEVKVKTYEYTNHVWVPFASSAARLSLMKKSEEAIETGKVVASQVSGTPFYRSDRKNWAEDLKQHILNTLEPAFVDESTLTRDVLSSMYDESRQHWHAAFTSSSSDPNEGNNYELLEKIGDSAAKIGLQDALILHRPHISEHELTVAINTVLAKQEQARVSTALGFPQFIRTAYPDVNVSETEDLFESFFGALKKMGEPEQIDFFLVERFLWHLNNVGIMRFTDKIFDTPPKTQVVTLFKKLGWEDPIQSVVREGEGWRARILVSEATRRNRHPIYMLTTEDAKAHIEEGTPYAPVPEQYISVLLSAGEVGNARGENEDLALYNAYADAVRRFREIGLIRDASLQEHYRLGQDFDRSLEESYANAYKRAKSEGYDNIFSTDAKLRYDKQKRNAFVLLIGIRGEERDTIYVLSIPMIPKNKELFDEKTRDKRELRRILYEAYANDRNIVRPIEEIRESDTAIHEDEEDEEDDEE